MTWFSSGADNHSEESSKSRQSSGFDVRDIYRWYIPQSEAGNEKRLVFLDDEPFNCWMHHYEKNGRWGNWETCLRKAGVGKCPLCERDDKVYTGYIGHYTVIDKSGWMQDGEHRMALKVLPAKSERVQILEKERNRRGSLIGAEFAVERTKDAKDNTGNYWAYMDRIDLGKFMDENLSKISYQLDYFPEEWGFWDGSEDNRNYKLPHGLPFEKILEPLTYDEVAQKAGMVSRSSSSSGDGSSSGSNGGFSHDPEAVDDHDVPY